MEEELEYYLGIINNIVADLARLTKERDEALEQVSYEREQRILNTLCNSKELKDTKKWLGEILAIMLGDGGQRLAEVGPEQAVKEALENYYNLYNKYDQLKYKYRNSNLEI